MGNGMKTTKPIESGHDIQLIFQFEQNRQNTKWSDIDYFISMIEQYAIYSMVLKWPD